MHASWSIIHVRDHEANRQQRILFIQKDIFKKRRLSCYHHATWSRLSTPQLVTYTVTRSRSRSRSRDIYFSKASWILINATNKCPVTVTVPVDRDSMLVETQHGCHWAVVYSDLNTLSNTLFGGQATDVHIPSGCVAKINISWPWPWPWPWPWSSERITFGQISCSRSCRQPTAHKQQEHESDVTLLMLACRRSILYPYMTSGSGK